ncbi:SMP-30/gluconolactonase/LRE family protein, partial [Pseudomonas syringae group genomosp. 7]|uniref:SMP-30/gluconolactonase/LRE family protein n=1 Tax=Pseudomonas syringae group genomosp. 7 TaxID=251699 RepID=UPI0037705161
MSADRQSATGETPVWIEPHQARSSVDIPTVYLHSWRFVDDSTRCWNAQLMLACMAADSRGVLIAGLERGIFDLQ